MFEVSVQFSPAIDVEVSLPLTPAGGTCLPSTYRNSDSTFSQEIESGEIFTSDPIEVSSPPAGNSDQSGIPVLGYKQIIPTNKDVDIPNSIVSPYPGFPGDSKQLIPGKSVAGSRVIIRNSAGSNLFQGGAAPILKDNGDVGFGIFEGIIADVEVNTDTQTFGPFPAGIDIDIPGEIVEKAGIQYLRPPLEATTSYQDYDEGYYLQDLTFLAWYGNDPTNPIYCQRLDPNNPLLLKFPNIHGNYNRFTDRLGGQIYADGIAQCHLTYTYIYTGLYAGNTNYSNQLTSVHAATEGGIENWMVFPRRYVEVWINQGSAGWHPAFASIPTSLIVFTSTTDDLDTTKVWSLGSSKRILNYSKSFSASIMMMAPGDW